MFKALIYNSVLVAGVALSGCGPAKPELAVTEEKEISWREAFNSEAKNLKEGEVLLQGTLVLKEVFGPPGYGETPQKDNLGKALVLDMPVLEGFEVEGMEDNSKKYSFQSSYVQLATEPGSKAFDLVGEKVSVQGIPFMGISGHHITPVLVQVQKVTRLAGK